MRNLVFALFQLPRISFFLGAQENTKRLTEIGKKQWSSRIPLSWQDILHSPQYNYSLCPEVVFPLAQTRNNMELHFIKRSSPPCKQARCRFRPVYTTDFLLGWCWHLCWLKPYVITLIKSVFPPQTHFVHVYRFSNKTASVFTEEKGAQGASFSLQ